MSVALSSSGGSPSPQDTSLDDLDLWRRDVRAKVTSLKCHVMALRGLTPQGTIVEPYASSILLQEPQNAQFLQDVDQQEVEAYVTAAMQKSKSPYGREGLSADDVTLEVTSEQPSSLEALPSICLERLSSLNGLCDSDESSSSSTSDSGPRHNSSWSSMVDLEQELDRAKEDLRKNRDEVVKLGRIRDEVEAELQDLTANLFQEAHGMVREANQRAANAERNLKEAQMQVEVLQAEVTALKALVITSTPAAPNAHLHPQLGASQATLEGGSGKKIFQRGHRKFPSDFDLKYGRDTTPPSSPLKSDRLQDTVVQTLDTESWEVDPVVHREFVAWRQEPTLDRSSPFMRRIYEEHIDRCLDFPNSTLGHQVQKAIEDSAIFVEEVNLRQKTSAPRKCILFDVPRFCKYRFCLGEKDPTWYYISQLARNRIIAVCDFLNYLRYIKQGLVKSSVHDVYWEIVKLRRQMSLARLGC